MLLFVVAQVRFGSRLLGLKNDFCEPVTIANFLTLRFFFLLKCFGQNFRCVLPSYVAAFFILYFFSFSFFFFSIKGGIALMFSFAVFLYIHIQI